MMTSENETLLWVVNELLSRFAGTFSIADNGYTFELFSLPAAQTPADAVALYGEQAGASTKGCNWHFQVEELKMGDEEVRQVLERWMNSPFWYFDQTLSMVQSPPPLADLVMECLKKLGASRFARLNITSTPGESMRPFYECAWDDFLIQTPDGFLLLHLAVSD